MSGIHQSGFYLCFRFCALLCGSLKRIYCGFRGGILSLSPFWKSEILDNYVRKSRNRGQICTKSRKPGRFLLGFLKSWKSRTLFWVLKSPSFKMRLDQVNLIPFASMITSCGSCTTLALHKLSNLTTLWHIMIHNHRSSPMIIQSALNYETNKHGSKRQCFHF